MLTIIIPSRKDKHIINTVNDILKNATGDIEIIVMLEEGWVEINNPKVTLVYHSTPLGMRGAINQAVNISHGEYLMKCDAHCMFDKGFDTKMLASIDEHTIAIPRRYKLDPENWEFYKKDPGPIDHEKLMLSPERMYGQQWPSREKSNKDIMIDETMSFQGSCWFMSRKHWDNIGPLDELRYGPFTAEPTELSLKTWLSGGRVIVNKNTWYAHKHRDFTRTWNHHRSDMEPGNKAIVEYWLNNRWADRIHDIRWLYEKFGQVDMFDEFMKTYKYE